MQGSAAISSDAYFGREQRGGGGASGSNVDMTAGDLISKVSITAKQDMDSLKQVGLAPADFGASGVVISSMNITAKQDMDSSSRWADG